VCLVCRRLCAVHRPLGLCFGLVLRQDQNKVAARGAHCAQCFGVRMRKVQPHTSARRNAPLPRFLPPARRQTGGAHFPPRPGISWLAGPRHTHSDLSGNNIAAKQY